MEKPVFFNTFAGTRFSGISEKVLSHVEDKRRFFKVVSKSFEGLFLASFFA
jgi:hypothetical protein